jgi:hypothetical protein
MSRGYGITQRFILDFVYDPRATQDGAPRWYPVAHLAAVLSGHEQPERSAVQSVRRAARKLAEQGMVDVALVPFPQSYTVWGEWEAERRSTRRTKLLAVRRPLEADEQTASVVADARHFTWVAQALRDQ